MFRDNFGQNTTGKSPPSNLFQNESSGANRLRNSSPTFVLMFLFQLFCSRNILPENCSPGKFPHKNNPTFVSNKMFQGFENLFVQDCFPPGNHYLPEFGSCKAGCQQQQTPGRCCLGTRFQRKIQICCSQRF